MSTSLKAGILAVCWFEAFSLPRSGCPSKFSPKPQHVMLKEIRRTSHHSLGLQNCLRANHAISGLISFGQMRTNWGCIAIMNSTTSVKTFSHNFIQVFQTFFVKVNVIIFYYYFCPQLAITSVMITLLTTDRKIR